MIQPTTSLGMSRREALSVLAGPLVLKDGPDSGILVTHLANYGVVISDGRQAVVVDGLFRDGVPPYKRVPAEELSKLEAGDAPYNKVSVVLVSHSHRDHFDQHSVAALLDARRSVQLWSSPQVCGAVLEVLARPQAQVQQTIPQAGAKAMRRFGELEVTVFRVEHGRGREDVQNLGHLIRMSGMTFLHVGDAAAPFDDLRAANLERERVDVALLPWWLLADPEVSGLIRNRISPKTIIVMHVSPDDERKGLPRVTGQWSDLRMAVQPGESWRF